MKALQGDTSKMADKITVDALSNILQKIEKGSVLIIDEIYTATQQHLIDLLEVARNKNLKLIFSGDSNQNLPTEKNIVGLLPDAVATLKLTNRAQDKGYQKYTELVLEQKSKKGTQAPLDVFKDAIMSGNDVEIEQKISEGYVLKLKEVNKHNEEESVQKQKDPKYRPDVWSVLALAGTEDVDRLNDLIQKELIGKEKAQEFKVTYTDAALINGVFRKEEGSLKTRTIKLIPESKIVLKETCNNDPDMEAGTVWNVKAISGEKLTIERYDETSKKTLSKGVDASQFKAFDLGYAKDSLSSQGQSVTYVDLLLNPHIDDAGIYVLLTRHKGLGKCSKSQGCSVEEKGIQIYARESEFPNADAVIQYIWDDLNEEGKSRTRRILLSSDAACLSEEQLLSLKGIFEQWDGESPLKVTQATFQGNERFLGKLKHHLRLFGNYIEDHKDKDFTIKPHGKVKKFILDVIYASLEDKMPAEAVCKIDFKNRKNKHVNKMDSAVADENLLDMDDYDAPSPKSSHSSNSPKSRRGSKDHNRPSVDLMDMDEKDNLPPKDHNRSLNAAEIDQDGEELLPQW